LKHIDYWLREKNKSGAVGVPQRIVNRVGAAPAAGYVCAGLSAAADGACGAGLQQDEPDLIRSGGNIGAHSIAKSIG
jgi:hypothetical protein